MNKSLQIGLFVIALFTVLTISCSKEDESGIKNLFIEAEKNLIVLGFDTIKLSSVARDKDLKVVDGIPVTYSVNGNPVTGDTYIPQTVGRYDFVGKYQGVESNVATVNVTTLEDELNRFELKYNGNQYLTTNEWSVSGTFSFNAVLGNLNIDIPFQEVQLLIDGVPIDQNRFIHFDEAGTYRLTATFAGKESNPIRLFVRQELQYDEVTIPVVFHTYGLDYPRSEFQRLLDTLNSAFSKPTYSLDGVKNGLINPNAVDCRMRFVMSTTDKHGELLMSPGINEVEVLENKIDTMLFGEDFAGLERQHNLSPETAINFWVAENIDFSWRPLNERETSGSGDARGLANTPALATLELDGIPTLTSLFNAVDTTGVSHSIVLRAESIFGLHPDFIVNRVGYHFGLFDTQSFACAKEGDHCLDTFAPNYDQPHNGTNTFPACNGLIYRPNNFMGIKTNKVCFTYDQRERLRFIMEHGLSRPGN